MYRNSFALLLVVSCFLITGCGDSHEKVTRDSIGQLKKMLNVLENVKTIDDAKAAKSKLDAIAKNMKSISARMQKLGDPSPEIEKKLKAKYEDELKQLLPKLITARIGLPADVQKELANSMKDMPKGL